MHRDQKGKKGEGEEGDTEEEHAPALYVVVGRAEPVKVNHLGVIV